MSLASMTGFARASGALAGLSWIWEIKSVNGRGLDVRARVPAGFDALDLRIRELAQAAFKRGNLQITLNVERAASASKLRINREALEQVMALARELERSAGLPPPTVDGLLAVRGVIETDESAAPEQDVEARDTVLLNSLKEALGNLAKSRADEGAKLKTILDSQIKRIETLRKSAAAIAARAPEALKARLKEQLRLLLEASPALSEERLAQEAAVLATRFDIREEIDRLGAHVEQANALIAGPEAAGRRLDFLAQEFNREANTLCSKSSDVELTRIGLDLKATIDQFREQVQNVE